VLTAARICRRRLTAAVALAVSAAAPFYVFHQVVQDAATNFRVEIEYLVSGWVPWLLVVVGALCFVPVIVSIGRSAFSRWSLPPAIRTAYEVWGATLYILGVLLLTQTAQVSSAF
jgi:hypothetical protein